MTRFIHQLMSPYRKWLLAIFCAMLVQMGAAMATPWPLKIILDSVIGNQPLPGWLSWLRHTPLGSDKIGLLGMTSLSLVLMVTLGAIAGYVNNYFTECVGQHMANDLRLKTYNHFQKLSLQYYDTHKVGKMVSIITTDVNTINQFASATPLEILVSGLEILGMLGVMFWLNWDFAMVALGLLPILVLMIFRFKNSIKHATREEREKQSDLVGVLEQGLGSMRAIKAYGRQDLEMRRLQGVSEDNIISSLKVRKLKSLFYPIIVFVASTCTAFILWRGTQLVMSGMLTVGALTVFLYYLSRFFRPVQNIARITGNIAQVSVAFERLHSILDSDTMMHQKENKIDPEKIKGEIAFEHVDFRYGDGPLVLKDIHFTIHPGERIGICGPTGSGKSTLVSLIPRFYDPSQGKVIVDGVDVADYDVWKLRGQISYVLQDTLVFAGTILENIAYGRTDATFEEMAAAAKMANADEFISRMPNGYNTIVGDGGSILSGGQRQRIGIARAIVRNSPILILDEPTVALDNESERLVMEALNRLMAGRTVITVTHRLHTIRDADRIYVLKEGSIAEEGTHGQLMDKGGIYAGLYAIPAISGDPVISGGPAISGDRAPTKALQPY